MCTEVCEPLRVSLSCSFGSRVWIWLFQEEEGGGLFGWLKNLGGGGGNKADDAAERARANGRAAADDIKDSARSARNTVQDKVTPPPNPHAYPLDALADLCPIASPLSIEQTNGLYASMSLLTAQTIFEISADANSCVLYAGPGG